MSPRRIAVVAGDGIGPEVIAASIRVIEAAGVSLEYDDVPISGERYADTGVLFADGEFERLSGSDAILFGAVGDPRVPAGVLERGVLLRLRFELDLGVNVRPARLLPGEQSVVSGISAADVDWLFIRENTEGPYAGTGGVFRLGTPDEIALQDSVNTRRGVERAVRYAFERAARRSGRLAWVHKTNVLTHASALWERVVRDTHEEWPDIEVHYEHADAACIHLVHDPARYDVIVTDNLFGDILTDLAGALSGGIGLAASANIDPGSGTPGLFEPAHGSAPDIAGKGIANPTATVLSAAMMLDHLGEREAAARIEAAVLEASLAGGLRGSTEQVTDAVIERIS